MDAAATGPHSGGLVTTGIAAITDYLAAHHVRHEVLEHEEARTARAEARAVDRPPRQVAKTVVLHDGAAYLLAVIPASERLDLAKVRYVLGASRQLRLATESEMASDFPGIEVGATPPIGPLFPIAELVDRRLLEADAVVCAAGDHRHSLVLAPRDIVRLGDATVGDLCLQEDYFRGGRDGQR